VRAAGWLGWAVLLARDRKHAWWADIVLSIALLPQLAISCCAYLHLPTPSLLPALPCLPACPAENDLRPIFEPFGPLDFLTLQRDMAARATGNAYVQ
jgi:hypothetical protein